MSTKADPTAVKQSTSTWMSYFKLTRLHKFPAGTDITFWPCTWGLTMSAYAVGMSPRSLAIQYIMYLVGSTLYHSAGCIWNDICDRDFDKQVARTRGRPIASGRVSVPGALIFFAVHCLVSMFILSFAGDMASQLGLFGLFFLNMLYPLMKRWTNWPQAWLGIALAWGVPVSWVSNVGSMDWTLIPALLLGGVCWTIHYDSIYACQDREDDIKAGIKSTAVLFGDNIRLILTGFSSALVACLVLAGVTNNQGLLYYIISVGGGACHLAWQLTTVDFKNPADCWAKFKANGYLGLIIWAGMLADYAQMRVYV